MFSQNRNTFVLCTQWNLGAQKRDKDTGRVCRKMKGSQGEEGPWEEEGEAERWMGDSRKRSVHEEQQWGTVPTLLA